MNENSQNNLSLSYLRQMVNITAISIVKFTILPNESNIFDSFMYTIVLFFVKFLLDEAKIHWVFDYLGVVLETESFPGDWLSERVYFVYVR